MKGSFALSVNFQFDIDEKVKVTALGIVGIVSMCAINEDNAQSYFVKTEKDSGWFPVRRLEAVKEEASDE